MMNMFLSKLMAASEAQKLINSCLEKSRIEEIPLEEANQRVIAQEITSYLNSPPFNRSAMDGYAIVAEDSFGHSENNPFQLKLVGNILAGQKSGHKLKPGEAIKIATGAPIPSGASAVVMEEYTHEESDTITVETSVVPGENISPAGEDFKQGDQVLKDGQLLGPAELAIIASAGYDRVKVCKKPKIAVIITGSELVMPKRDIEGPEVINSNHFTIKSMVESCLSTPDMFHSIDNAQQVEQLFKKLLNEYDALITTGGTAISKGDVVVDVAQKLGEVPIHGVSLRPGKPFGFAQIQGKPVFMLSGFPVAAMVQFDVFVREALLKMQGLTRDLLVIHKKAARKIPSTLGRTDYIRAKIEGPLVRPLKIKGSGIIKSMVDSDSYIIIPENLEGIEEGEECQVLPYHSLKA